MQQKNLVVFLVLCVTILVGWGWLQQQLWPPPPKKDQSKEKKAPQDEGKPPAPKLTVADLQHKLPQFAAGAVGEAAGPLGILTATAAAGRVETGADEVRADVRRKLNYAAQAAALVGAPHPLASAAVLRRVDVHPNFRPAAGTGEAPLEIDLDDPQDTKGLFYLKVKLNTRGGGIQRLTLPKFQAADEYGRPLYHKGAKGAEPVPLDLIPADSIRPSFLLFHYRDADGDPDNPSPAKRAVPLPDLGVAVWKLEGKPSWDGDRKVRRAVLSVTGILGHDGLTIRKTYTLKPKEYHVGLQIEIIDERRPDPGADVRPFRYQLTGAHGLPVEGEWYSSLYRNPLIGLLNKRGNLWRDLDETQYRIAFRNGGDRVPLQRGDSHIQYAGVQDQYFASLIVVDNEQGKERDEVPPTDVVDYARPTLESTERLGIYKGPKFVGEDTLLLLQTKESPDLEEYRLLPAARKIIEERKVNPGDAVIVNFYEAYQGGKVATGVRPGHTLRPHLDDITVRVVSNVFKELKPGTRVLHKYLLYNGPVKVSLLDQFTGDKAVAPELVNRYWDTLHLRTLTDYHSPGPIGKFANSIFWTDLIVLFTRLMHWLLNVLHFILPNYGLTIILLTLIVRGLMFPISRRQAMLSIKMQELGPEVKKLQEKYKSDPTAKTKATMELYRKHHVNPLGGCLTLLLQLPVFMGLYYALQESIHFRLAGFLWIDNLAAPDMLLWWGESIPIISNPDSMGGIGYLGPYLNLLPVCAVALMLVQQKMMTPPAADEQQAMQQSMMKYMMIIFGFLFYKLAAGLCLYFIVSSLWGLAERRLLPKKPLPGVAGAGRGGSGGGGGGPGPRGGRKPGPGSGKKGQEPDGAIQKVRNWWQEVLKQAKKK